MNLKTEIGVSEEKFNVVKDNLEGKFGKQSISSTLRLLVMLEYIKITEGKGVNKQ